jgi:methylated-DNA-[protein]-cysteine S-methyltransferase
VNSMKQSRSDHNDFLEVFESPVGALYLVLRGPALISVSFHKPPRMVYKQTKAGAALKKELEEYFSGERMSFDIGTSFVEGTAFEKEVWEALKKVPYGETKTYKWVAEHIGKPQAFRAVGNALAKNPIPIIYPCHRIIESDGSIGGYTPGTDIKRRLLEIEYYTKLARA